MKSISSVTGAWIAFIALALLVTQVGCAKIGSELTKNVSKAGVKTAKPQNNFLKYGGQAAKEFGPDLAKGWWEQQKDSESKRR